LGVDILLEGRRAPGEELFSEGERPALERGPPGHDAGLDGGHWPSRLALGRRAATTASTAA